MILEIKIANYRSINEEQVISFVADNSRALPDNLTKRKGYRLLKALALFGPNASGKSNLCRALYQVGRLVQDSAETLRTDFLADAAQAFRLSPDSRDAPSRYEITCSTENLIHRYGFSVSARRIEEEWLYVSREGDDAETAWFHRKSAQHTPETPWIFDGPLREEAPLLQQRTRAEALILSVAALFNVGAVRRLFLSVVGEMRIVSMADAADTILLPAVFRFYEDIALRGRVLQILDSVDIGLADLQVSRKSPVEPFNRFIGASSAPGFGPNVSPAMASVQQAYLLRSFRRDAGGDLQAFDFLKEDSTGTLRLFALAVLLLDALDTGQLVVVDELDASLHPLLTRRLLEMFQSPELNTKGAQLLFTTHDVTLLSPVLFRRDQILLAERRRGGSQFYALSDVEPPPRNAEKYLQNYLSGRYGGTPYLGLDYEYIADKVTR